VGDAGNDLPALSVVGHPVAMADAPEAVKQAAARSVGRAEDGAVADAIEFAVSTWG
jgi:hydroxymethylpyrimidine pyrophosphatase-like HAD family hydrolase